MRKILVPVLLLTAILILNISSALTAEPLIQAAFSITPSVVAPGNDGYIQLTLKNSGTAPANRIRISSASWDSSIIPSGSWLIELGALGAGDSATALFKFSVASTASSGLYVVKFNVEYCQDSSCRTLSPNVVINVQSPPALEVTSVKPSTLKLGERANMTFTITNKGDYINNAIFTWVSTGGILLPIGSTNRVVIPTISANSFYEVTSEIVVSPTATPGVYPINIYIQYLDKSGTNQSILSVAGVEISAETDFDVSIQDYTGGSATLAIANIGSTTAYSAVVRIPQQENFRVIGASSNVLGNLNAGDYTLTSFQIIPSKPEDGIKKLAVEVSYTDVLGVRRTVEKEVWLTAINITEAWRTRTIGGNRFALETSLTYIIIGVAGIVCIVAILKLRKRIKR